MAVWLTDATNGDAATIARVIVAAFRAYQGRLDPPSGALRDDEASVLRRLAEGSGLLVLDGEQVIGSVFWNMVDDYLQLGRLAVLPEHQGRGIGRRLVRAVETRALALGRPKVRLGVRLALEDNLAFYERQGYRVIEYRHHTGYSEPTWVMMEKVLAPLPDPRELLRLHMALECIAADGEGTLRRVPCEHPDEIHRVYAARHAEGLSVFFRADLPAPLRATLMGLPPEVIWEQHARVCVLLAAAAPVEAMHVGQSYIFPPLLQAPDDPEVVCLPVMAGASPQFALLVDGVAVSTCESSREQHFAGEAWVQTHPDFRGRGFGARVSTAWARSLQAMGKIPFYSHAAHNVASQALARRLGLIPYIADVGYG